jgi:hypothetical protein
MSVFAAAASMWADTGASVKTKPPLPAHGLLNVPMQSPGVRVARAEGSNIDIGPDPFALPWRKAQEPARTPFRKAFHIDTPFLGHVAPVYEPLTLLKTKPPIDTPDPSIRMAGFLIGNAIVVNPGDHIDDDRLVTEIRPNETRLRGESDSTNTVPLHP